jgi:hypothetical protein
MESFGSGWRSGSRSPVGPGGMLVTARPHSVLDLLAGCAAHSLWRLLHDDQPGLPVGDLLLDSPVWHGSTPPKPYPPNGGMLWGYLTFL